MTRALRDVHYLAASGAGVLAAGLGMRPALADAPVRQGYQTNMWGMPTYYLLHSGLLEKHGVKFEEYAVPSGNLTMQQMVARQVDMGTYAGPSFIIGYEKGGLVAIAKIEYVGKTARVMARKDLGMKTVADLQGQEGRQPDRLVDRQHLRRPDRHQSRPAQGRLPGNPHERERHGGGDGGQDRGRHGQCRALQRDRGSRRHRQHARRLLFVRQAAGVHGGDAGIRRQESGHGRELPEGLAGRREGLQERPEEGRRHDLRLLHLEGLQDVEGHLRRGDRPRRGRRRLAGRSRDLHDARKPKC